MSDTTTTAALEFDASMSRASAAMASGRHAEALEWIDRALVLRPRDVQAWNAKGVILGALGRFDDAALSFKRAMAEQPMSPDLHYNLGHALQRQRRFTEALSSYNLALTLLPNYPEALNNRGLTLEALGRYPEAAASIERALFFNPRDFEMLLNLGRIHLLTNNLPPARQALESALRVQPGHVEAHLLLGRCLSLSGQLIEGASHFEAILAVDPGHSEAIEAIAATYRLREEPEQLVNLLRALTDRAPMAPAVWLELGVSLASLNRRSQARDCFRRVLELDPNNATALGRIGRSEIELGNLTRAKELLQMACELAPRSAFLLRSLTDVTKVESEDLLLVSLERLLSEMDASDPDRAEIHFALGKALADVGDNERSFAQFLEANRIRRAHVRYDESAILGPIARTIQLFSPSVVRRCEGGGNTSRLPVFILGMPRTGSTLVEQILAAHDKVLALGELSAFGLAVSEVDTKKGVAFPDWLATFDRSDASALGDAYLSRLMSVVRAWDVPSFEANSGSRTVDKMPGNFRYAGLIKLALPNAKIIHTRRDRVDTCLSCFQKPFENLAMTFSYDLGELGRSYRYYENLMAAWSATLPKDAILTVDYESLVTDFENVARQIVAFCDLEWRDECLSFHKVDRAVRTLSALQVRQPVYSTSLKKWRPPAQVMRPLLDELEASG